MAGARDDEKTDRYRCNFNCNTRYCASGLSQGAADYWHISQVGDGARSWFCNYDWSVVLSRSDCAAPTTGLFLFVRYMES